MPGTAASRQFPCQTCEVRDKVICAALDDEELRHLSAIATAVELKAEGVVFHEGDDSTYLFNVVTGSLRLSKLLPDGRRQITGFLFPGDFLGLSIADVYAYSAEAMTETSLCRFSRANLTKMLERFPKLEHRLLDLASNELAQAQDHLMILGRKTAIERLLTILLKLAERVGQRDSNGMTIELPMSRTDLADYLGLTTETVSRTITRLRNEGAVKTPNWRTICIPKGVELALRTGD
ncbi:cyclic nucleotide-binding domain-containing protein [Pelagibius litoralis]|uniref:Cyclic nucleotide-binding domain-containing protein n=1 Tax=Pelagibius litoralis TaxID=374515 RepID=A0A967F3Q3_9PROT|nr:cyclic nucleotide-binding domain-containing protein [Pelagibius litoralis]NIA72310.1 cyclic nucleotide-binding domain-containing protein [Pelagibius litoralis]